MVSLGPTKERGKRPRDLGVPRRVRELEARLAKLEAFVAQWAVCVGAPGTQHATSAEALLASGFDPHGGA